MKSLWMAAAVAGAIWGGPGQAQTPAPAVEPAAVTALARMSAYMGTLRTFEVKAVNTLDLVLDDGQKVQLDGVTTYKVRRPDGFVIENATDRKVRRFIYDGRRFTVYAPQLGFYAQADAPPTIRQMVDAVRDDYAIDLPLEDLFHWSEPDQGGEPPLQSAAYVGDAVIDGADAQHYAFRQGDVDWQVWIRKGERPLPLKLVVVSRIDDARPAYSARLSWNTAPTFTQADFAFQPQAGAKPIRFASQDR